MVSEIKNLLFLPDCLKDRGDYARAIIEDNILGKKTVSTRRLTNRRLGELYILDPRVPLFSRFRQLASFDPAAIPLMAILAALARDPLLRTTADLVISLTQGADLSRDTLLARIAEAASGQLNKDVQKKVGRNIASSWTQSGHLAGQTRKTRRIVEPTPTVAVMALWLARQAGFSDTEAIGSGWMRVIDCDRSGALSLAKEAKRLGLIDIMIAEDVVSLDFSKMNSLRAECRWRA